MNMYATCKGQDAVLSLLAGGDMRPNSYAVKTLNFGMRSFRNIFDPIVHCKSVLYVLT